MDEMICIYLQFMFISLYFFRFVNIFSDSYFKGIVISLKDGKVYTYDSLAEKINLKKIFNVFSK